MKNIILLLIFFKSIIIFSQEEKESIYLFFDSNEKRECRIEDGSGGTYKSKFYHKEKTNKKILFNICDERFSFDRSLKTDTCDIKNLSRLNVKNLEYIKEKYYKGRELKHHVFKKINILEKISETKIVKYYDVYWIGAWEED